MSWDSRSKCDMLSFVVSASLVWERGTRYVCTVVLPRDMTGQENTDHTTFLAWGRPRTPLNLVSTLLYWTRPRTTVNTRKLFYRQETTGKMRVTSVRVAAANGWRAFWCSQQAKVLTTIYVHVSSGSTTDSIVLYRSIVLSSH